MAVSKRALLVCTSKYDTKPPLPSVLEDQKRSNACLRELGFTVTSLADGNGRLTRDNLISGVADFVQTAADDYKKSGSCTLVIVISGHGRERETQSMGTRQEVMASDGGEGLDVHRQLVQPLNRLRGPTCDAAGLTCIFILDCCRKNSRNTVFKSAPAWELKHDFYFIFSCDPGAVTSCPAEGGVVVSAVMKLLQYRVPITDVLNQAMRDAEDGDPGRQRAWVHIRAKGRTPTLGWMVPPQGVFDAAAEGPEHIAPVPDLQEAISPFQSRSQSQPQTSIPASNLQVQAQPQSQSSHSHSHSPSPRPSLSPSPSPSPSDSLLQQPSPGTTATSVGFSSLELGEDTLTKGLLEVGAVRRLGRWTFGRCCCRCCYSYWRQRTLAVPVLLLALGVLAGMAIISFQPHPPADAGPLPMTTAGTTLPPDVRPAALVTSTTSSGAGPTTPHVSAATTTTTATTRTPPPLPTPSTSPLPSPTPTPTTTTKAAMTLSTSTSTSAMAAPRCSQTVFGHVLWPAAKPQDNKVAPMVQTLNQSEDRQVRLLALHALRQLPLDSASLTVMFAAEIFQPLLRLAAWGENEERTEALNMCQQLIWTGGSTGQAIATSRFAHHVFGCLLHFPGPLRDGALCGLEGLANNLGSVWSSGVAASIPIFIQALLVEPQSGSRLGHNLCLTRASGGGLWRRVKEALEVLCAQLPFLAPSKRLSAERILFELTNQLTNQCTTVVEQLSSKSDAELAMVLAYLTVSSTTARRKAGIIQKGHLPKLVQCLSHVDMTVQRRAANLLSNLATKQPQNLEVIADAGAIQPLLRLLTNSTDHAVRVAAADALCKLACASKNVHAIAQAGVLPSILEHAPDPFASLPEVQKLKVHSGVISAAEVAMTLTLATAAAHVQFCTSDNPGPSLQWCVGGGRHQQPESCKIKFGPDYDGHSAQSL